MIFLDRNRDNIFTCRVKAFDLSLVWLWLRESYIKLNILVDLADRFNLISFNRNVNTSISPCGICCQILREFCSLDMPIFLVPGDYPKPQEPGQEAKPGYTEGGVRETTLKELFPYGFGPEHLELPRKPAPSPTPIVQPTSEGPEIKIFNEA